MPNKSASEPSSLLFTGQLRAKQVEFPRVPRIDLNRDLENNFDMQGRTPKSHSRAPVPADYNYEYDDNRSLKPQRSQVYKEPTNMYENKLLRLAKTVKSSHDQYRVPNQRDASDSHSARFNNEWFNQQSNHSEHQAPLSSHGGDKDYEAK